MQRMFSLDEIQLKKEKKNCEFFQIERDEYFRFKLNFKL